MLHTRSYSAKGLPSWPYPALMETTSMCIRPARGALRRLHTQPETLNDAERDRQSEFSVFPFVHLPWKLQTCLTTRLRGRREEAPRWVRPKGSLAKRLPWLVTNICIKSIRKRKYGEILHLIHSPDLPGSAIQGHPGCKGTVGPLCAHPCSDPSHVGKTLSLSHTRRDGYFHPLPALSQATHCSSAEKSHMSKCLSWHQLHAIDVNGSGQLYTSWWSPSSPSQQIFWCPTYKISTEKVDLVQQVLCDACDTGLCPLSQRKV